jgi:hypothetical protein
MKSVLRAGPTAPDLPVHTRALDIASWALAILATQSAIASVAFREMSETLGSTQVRNGIVPDSDGCFRVYAAGIPCNAFDTFDAALEDLNRRLLVASAR